jgi:hypothetical protein
MAIEKGVIWCGGGDADGSRVFCSDWSSYWQPVAIRLARGVGQAISVAR